MSVTETTAWLLLKLSTFPPQQQKASVNHTFPFSIPDTVILRQGVLQNWYYTSSTGQILQNPKSSTNVLHIADSFKQKQQDQRLPAATFYFDKTQRNGRTTGGQRSATCIGQLEGKDLKKYLAAGVNVGLSTNTATVMQAYTASHSNHNSVIRVTLNLDNTVQMVMFTNQIPLDDQSWPMVKKLATIEAEISNTNVRREVLSQHGTAFTQLWYSLKDIRYQIALRAGATILGGNFFFKLSNEQAHPVLLFATQLHMDRPVQGLPEPAVESVIQQMEFSVVKNKPGQSLQSALMRAATTMKPQPSATQWADHGAYQSEPIAQPRRVKLRPWGACGRNGINLGAASIGQGSRQHNFYSSAQKTPQQAQACDGSGYSDFERAALPDLTSSSIGKHLRMTRQSKNNFTPTTEKCAFCRKAYTRMQRKNFDEPEIDGIVNPNQIKKLYEYFERDIASLLLVPASTHHQQQIFDGIYDQIKGIKVDEAYVPNLLQAAFNINSMQHYLALKDDPKFLFQEMRLCQPCYESVKKMLTFQSDGIIRESSSMSQQQFRSLSFANQPNLNSQLSNRSSYTGWVAAWQDYNAQKLIANLNQRQKELEQVRTKHKLSDHPLSQRKSYSKSSKRRVMSPTSNNPKNPNCRHTKTIPDGTKAVIKKKLDEAEKTYYYSYCSRHINCKQGHGGQVENSGTYVHYQRQLQPKKKKKKKKRARRSSAPAHLEMMYENIPVDGEWADQDDKIQPSNDIEDGQNQGANTFYPEKIWQEDNIDPQPTSQVADDDDVIMPPEDELKTEPVQPSQDDDGISEDIRPDDNDESLADKSVIVHPPSTKDHYSNSNTIQDNLGDDKDTITTNGQGRPKIIISHIMPEKRPFGVPVPDDLENNETPAEDIKESQAAQEEEIPQETLDSHHDSKYEKKPQAAKKKVIKRDNHKDQKGHQPRPVKEVIVLQNPPNEVPNKPNVNILQSLNLSEINDKLPQKTGLEDKVIMIQNPPNRVPNKDDAIILQGLNLSEINDKLPAKPQVFEKIDGQTLIDRMINATIQRKMTEKDQPNEKSHRSQHSDIGENSFSTIRPHARFSGSIKKVQFDVVDPNSAEKNSAKTEDENNEAIHRCRLNRQATPGAALMTSLSIEKIIQDEIEDSQKEEKFEEQHAQPDGSEKPNGDTERPEENKMRQGIVNFVKNKVIDVSNLVELDRKDEEENAQERASQEQESQNQQITQEMDQASPAEKQAVVLAQETSTVSIEQPDQDIHAVPDVDLLEFQRQRTTPVFMLSEIVEEGNELIHAEIDNFAEEANIDAAAHSGMAQAGSEEKIIRQLIKAGSLDARSIVPDLPEIKEINEQPEPAEVIIQQQAEKQAQEQKSTTENLEVIAIEDQFDEVEKSKKPEEEIQETQEEAQEFQEEIVEMDGAEGRGNQQQQYMELSQECAKSQKEDKDIVQEDFEREEQKVEDVGDALDQSVAEDWDTESDHGDKTKKQVDDQIASVEQLNQKPLSQDNDQDQKQNFKQTPLKNVLYDALNNRFQELIEEKKLREEEKLQSDDFIRSATFVEDNNSIDKSVDEQQKHPAADSTILSWVDVDQDISQIEGAEKANENPKNNNIDHIRDMFKVATTVDYDKLEKQKQAQEVQAYSIDIFRFVDSKKDDVKGTAKQVIAVISTAKIVNEMLDGIQECINEAVDVVLQDNISETQSEDPQQPPEQTPVMTSSIRIRKSMTVEGKRRVTASYVKHQEQ